MSKRYASEQAIPAWMKVKDTIVETAFEARRTLAKFRASGGNPALFRKLQDKVVTLYDLVKQDYDRDDKLRKRYPLLGELGDCLYSVNNGKPEAWWIARYNDVNAVIWDLGITKITQEDDSWDDFAGVDEI